MPEKPILESYVGEWYGPHEVIVGWLKWDKDFIFDNIVMKFDKDVHMYRLLNLDRKAFEHNEQGKGIFQFAKEECLITGFLGYHAVYPRIPDNELNLEISIEFQRQGETVLREVQTTLIRRPKVRLVEISHPDLFVTDSLTSYEELQLALIVEGADARDLQIRYIPPETNDGPLISIQEEELPSHLKRDPFSNQQTRTYIKVKGHGVAVVKIVAGYHDYIGNEYNDTLGSITIQVSTPVQQSIPVYYPQPQKEAPMLVAPMMVAQ